MTPEIWQNLKEVGIAIFSVGAVCYILYIFIQKGFSLFNKIQEEHREDQTWFRQFVDANNHQKSDMIEKHTKAVTEFTNSLEVHTKVLEKLVDKLN